MSTDFPGDLTQHNSILINFNKYFSDFKPEIADLLLYKNHWYVGSKSGCSCTFRHLSSVEIGFGKPVDWYKENSDEIEATRIFYNVAIRLISLGNKLDCIEIWSGTKIDQIKCLKVDLSTINRDDFRFFENHHFIFSNSQ